MFFDIIGVVVTICICWVYTCFRVQATSADMVVAIAGVSLIEGISIYCVAFFCLMAYAKRFCRDRKKGL